MSDTIPETSTYDEAPPRRLVRADEGRWLGGVCAGLGRYFDINPLVYRIAFAALALAGGTGLLLYVAAWLVMPGERSEESVAVEALRRHRDRPWLLLGVGLLSFGALLALSEARFWPSTGNLWLAATLGGAAVVWWHVANRDRAPSTASSATETASTATETVPAAGEAAPSRPPAPSSPPRPEAARETVALCAGARRTSRGCRLLRPARGARCLRRRPRSRARRRRGNRRSRDRDRGDDAAARRRPRLPRAGHARRVRRGGNDTGLDLLGRRRETGAARDVRRASSRATSSAWESSTSISPPSPCRPARLPSTPTSASEAS